MSDHVINPKSASLSVPNAVLVFDVGGSHISAAICSPRTYALLGLAHAAIPPEGFATHAVNPGSAPAHGFLRFLHALAQRSATLAGVPLQSVAGAALAMPGPFDYPNGVSHMQHKLPSLLGVDLKSAIAERFHWQPNQVRFVNDAAAFLLGEFGAGAAKGFGRSIGITLGTGIGCAFAVGGRIAMPPAPDNPAQDGGDPGVPPGGEIWNLPYNGATVEDFVSTRFLRYQYQNLTGLEAEVASIAETANGDHPCPENSPAASPLPPDDPYAAHCRARQSFQDFGRHLGLVLNLHAQPFHPDIIVLGGGISRASHLFLPATRKALAPGFAPKIAISTLMDQAPLTGAGVHWFTNPE
jgi:predicted NBD/HSP70 family sugar kinase